MSKLDNVKQWAEDASYFPGVWLLEAVTGDEGVTYIWQDDNENKRTHVLYPELLAAVEHLSAGTYTDYDGTEKPLAAYHLAACVNILNNYDDADYDAITDDIIAQQAALGKQIFA